MISHNIAFCESSAKRLIGNDSVAHSGAAVHFISSWDTTTSASIFNDDSRDHRKKRYDLQRHAHELLENRGRTCKCHKFTGKSGGGVALNADGRARYVGVSRCGDIWACPVCAPSVAAKRRDQIKSVLAHGHFEGFKFLFITYTCSHNKDDDIADLLDRQQKTLRGLKSGRWIGSVKDGCGYVDSISSKECTWGPQNGWHPHVHELWMCNLPADFDLQAFERKLSDRWVKQLEKQGLNGKASYALKVKLLDLESVDGIDDYFTKSGTAADMSWEMSGQEFKNAHKQGHVTPVQMLALSAQGDKEMGRLWLQFVNAYRGRKQIVFGRFIHQTYQDLYGTLPSDDELAEVVDKPEVHEKVVIDLEPLMMWALYTKKVRYKVLRLVEQYAIADAQALVNEVYDQWCSERYLAAVRHIRSTGRYVDQLPPEVDRVAEAEEFARLDAEYCSLGEPGLDCCL